LLSAADRGNGAPLADDAGSEHEPGAEPEPPRSGNGARGWLREHRTLALSLGCVALCSVIAADIYLMLKSDARRRAVASASNAAAGSVTPPAASPTHSSPQPAPAADPASEALDFESEDGEHATKPTAPKHFATVQQAAVESCTTASVDGLSRQIIAQARCLKPNAFVPLPSRPNLVVASQVFPYLEAGARERLLKALDARPKQKMTVNSALRTVAQQFLVWRWSAAKRCGVPLATPPGQSNHETGTALDIAEAGTWRPVLEAHGFKWLGASDRVHFDYKGVSAPTGSSTDVRAFQKLWNRNHPDDKLSEDGQYSPAVEQRLKQAPPDGFSIGPSCGRP
jgi:LAS superfamily LD-carboxypeptidase LdcB